MKAGWVWRWGRRLAMLAVALVASFIVLDRLFPPPQISRDDVSFMLFDRGGRPVAAFGTAEGRWRLPVDLDRVDPAFLAALLEVEDKRFYSHPGIDAAAMVRAAVTSLGAGEVVSGGSTITMQTARLLEPRPRRTLTAKGIEMFRALQLEMRYSKREILEIYLTLAPYGGNIEGLRAASWAYFGREPDRLSDAEIALLIALPQSPEVRRPDRRPQSARAGRRAVLAKLGRADVFNAQRIAEADAEPLPVRRAFPATAWHLAQKLKRQADESVTVSSLDLGLQLALEDMLAQRAEGLEGEAQLAAIVVHIPTRGVRTMVASADRGRPGGWLDLTQQARSPGSTLKPFIYAMAFDDGVASPSTQIRDLPRRFDSYRPENFDRSFRGDVKVSDALAHSLNVPAVLALDRVGPERFAAQLGFAGVSPRIQGMASREAGLALALGGAGMTMEEIAMLYAGLGDEGRVKPLAYTAGAEALVPFTPGARLMSPQSAASILDILRSAPAPAGRVPGQLTVGAPEIAFKTGTSYGFRDAWAAGVAGDYAIVVWVGRPDGAPRPGQTGRSAALPILFDIADRTYAMLGASESSDSRLRTREVADPVGPMARFEEASRPPEILFPPDQAELWAAPDRTGQVRSFVLAGRGDGGLTWYVNGEPAARDDAGAPIWAPDRPGFYDVMAVDADGDTAKVSVRVIGLGEDDGSGGREPR